MVWWTLLQKERQPVVNCDGNSCVGLIGYHDDVIFSGELGGGR